MTTPRPHAHAEALIPGGTTEMMEASSNDTASPARNSEERETVGPNAIRYPATTGVDPSERN